MSPCKPSIHRKNKVSIKKEDGSPKQGRKWNAVKTENTDLRLKLHKSKLGHSILKTQETLYNSETSSPKMKTEGEQDINEDKLLEETESVTSHPYNEDELLNGDEVQNTFLPQHEEELDYGEEDEMSLFHYDNEFDDEETAPSKQKRYLHVLFSFLV